MKRLPLLASALGGCVCLMGAPPVLAPPAARAQVLAPAADTPVEPEALASLRRMSAYLRTLSAFKVVSSTTLDEVTDDGQKLQIAGQTTYRVRKPDAFVIDQVSDRKVRTIYYGAKKLTVVAPRMGFYARVDAPGTIRETLDKAYDDYGIVLPLEELFNWTEDDPREAEIQRAFHVGYARIGGADCDHYAFRQGEIDWQIWIARGEQPTPRKIVITTRTEEGSPQFSAVLDWDLAPRFTAADFTFTPPADAKSITIATLR